MRYFYNAIVSFLLLLALVLLPTSCIQDEALNAEADILTCTVDTTLQLIREPVIGNDRVTLYVPSGSDLTRVAPRFTLTEGATLFPAGGTVRDFTSPQHYTVTSQDGRWSKDYIVEFISHSMATLYHFEKIRYYSATDLGGTTKDYYHIFTDYRSDGSLMEWGSGNAGFKITNGNAPATDYPTCQSDSGFKGKCAKLTTRSTGALGASMDAPLAAGNLFIGTFSINLKEMAKSTHMGVPFSYIPTRLNGYYKYRAGDVYTDAKGQKVTGKRDEFDIYAVFYEVTEDVPYLDGTNVQSSPNIVLFAQVQERKEGDEWNYFSVPFEPRNGKSIDPEKLKKGKYNITLVASSSKGGAFFCGAVGSTLCVDEMELEYVADE